jgi:hypothetical protein
VVGVKPTFEPLDRVAGVRVRDPIENAQFELYTDTPVDPEPAAADQFVLPVDAAASIEVGELELPQLLNVDVWRRDRTLVDRSVNQQVDEYPPDAYSLDVDLGPMKLSVATDSAFTVRRGENATVLAFPDATRIAVGARSLHESPAATITVGDDPEHGMRAVSLFGSALKTTSPERSFPTLRGHPPLVEHGDGFDAPAALSAPDTDVAIEIPRDWGDVYRVSSLAFYLGATVRPGDGHALVLDGDRHSLATDRGFEAETTRLLKHSFLLDCVVRTEGLYDVDLHACEGLADVLDFDLADAYEASLADRLGRYLDVPYEATAEYVPKWKLTADLAPEPGRVESLPFVVNDLAEMRVPEPEADAPDVAAEPEPVTEFLRGDGGVRSASESDTDHLNVVKPDAIDSIEHAWLTEGFPLGANKTSAAYYERRFDHAPREQDAIRIDIVCNDPTMAEEDVVEEFYGARDFFEFDITVHYDLDRAALRSLLAENIDFLHYIGHVEDGGFQCEDGLLDARTVEETGVRAFLLNACRSYRQGEALVDAGSIGGIVTLTNISNDPAVRVGRALARLLNNGFSLLAGLSVARNVTLFGNQYITIGDGTVQLVQSPSGTPVLSEVEHVGEEYELTVHGFPTLRSSLGSLFTLHLRDLTTQYLNSGKIDSFRVSAEELRTFLGRGVCPVLYEGSLTWSDDLLEDPLD